ncbi:MAG TPA: tetratricopeptide repeat protein [Candidatus Binataceae bacterium]|nr:tetratricopeptide repeat protein [Candidatus Binataceae bacterium]
MRTTSLLRKTLTAALAALSIAAVVACHHNSVDDLLATGDADMQANKLSDAEAAYSEAAKAAPNDPRVHVALANLYTFQHKTQPAQTEYMKVIDLDPRNAAAHVALGNFYLDQQQLREAEEQYRAAIALDPAHSSYYLQLADVLNREGRPADAEAEIRTAIGLTPGNAQAHLALSNLLQTQPGRQAEADAELSTARILDPKLAEAPAASNAPVAAPTQAVSGTPKVKPLNKVFLLTKNSPVYQDPDTTSSVIGQVHRKKYVHVVGLAGNYLQIKLRNGTVGFVPETAAE